MEDRASSRITVAIVDDHSMVAEGLGRLVEREQDLELVGTASSVADAITLVGATRPDVVLMDYQLPDGDGADASGELMRRDPQVRIVLLSGSGGSDLLARSIEAGCAGFIGKDRPGQDVVAAIRAAARGESIVRSDELAALVGSLRNKSKDQQILTDRELEVLRLLAKGHSTEDLAASLFVSIHTVRNHVRAVLQKLGAHSKLEAVAIAARDGIIDLSDVG